MNTVHLKLHKNNKTVKENNGRVQCKNRAVPTPPNI
jgi:hypothetical protein